MKRQPRAIFKQAATIRTEFGKRGAIFHVRQCQTCSKEFRIRDCNLRSHKNSGNYCSHQCYSDALKSVVGKDHHLYSVKTAPCPQCAKPVSLAQSRWKRAAHRTATGLIHCSRYCAGITRGGNLRGDSHPAWRGGHDEYRGPDWHDARREALSRAPFCAVCGRMGKLHVHHIHPYRLCQDNSQENLIPLCKSHHHLIEWETWKAEDKLGDISAYCEQMRILLLKRQAMVRRWFAEKLRERDSMPCVELASSDGS